MAIRNHKRDDNNISIRTNAYYEEQASQEEIYLEEAEEELRMILESDELTPQQSKSLDEQREHAAEELIIEIPMSLCSAKRQ